MTLPILTWSQTDYTTTGQTAPTDEQVIQALNTASANLTKWTVKSVDSSTWKYIEFESPDIGGKTMRVIVSVNPGDNSYRILDTASTGIWYGLAPDGGTLGTWNSATPYGADRWTKYTKCSETAKAESVYFIESEEALGIVFRDDSIDDFWAGFAGALFNPYGNKAEADGRIYGLITSGKRVIYDSFWNSNSEFFGSNGGNNYAHALAFRPLNPTTLDALQRLNTTMLDTTADKFLDGNGKENAMPVFWSSKQNPFYFLGASRQMYYGRQGGNRTILSNGITFASNSTGTTDTLYLLNS